jgi:hypothetical protein
MTRLEHAAILLADTNFPYQRWWDSVDNFSDWLRSQGCPDVVTSADGWLGEDATSTRHESMRRVSIAERRPSINRIDSD